MIPDRDVEVLLKTVPIRSRTDSSKLTVAIIETENRKETSDVLRPKVAKLDPNYKYGRVTGSSFSGGMEFQSKGRTIRLVFKETSSSKVGQNTPLMEAAQCIYLAAAQTKRGSIDTAYVVKHLNRIRSSFAVSSSVDKIMAALDATWKKSSEMIANHVYPKLRHNHYVFHHNSALVQKIYGKYFELNRANRMFRAADKWNPADIWGFRVGFTPDLTGIDSFDEFNSYIREMIDKGMILPISLKKVIKSPKIVTVNTNEYLQKAGSKVVAAETEFVGFKVNTGRTNWMSSKNCKIQMSKGKSDIDIEIRQSRAGASINGEMKIKRTAARHGKLHLDVFKRIFTLLGSRLEMPDKRALTRQSSEGDPELIRKVHQLASKLDKLSRVSLEEFTDFINEHRKSDPDWLASKYEAMLIVDVFAGLSSDKRQKACEYLYSAAAAADELAGPFIKVTERL